MESDALELTEGKYILTDERELALAVLYIRFCILVLPLLN